MEDKSDDREEYSCSRCGQGSITLPNDLQESHDNGGELVCGPDIGFFEFGAEHFTHCTNCEYTGDPGVSTSWFKRIVVYTLTLGTALIFDIIFALTGHYQIGSAPSCKKCNFENLEKWYMV